MDKDGLTKTEQYELRTKELLKEQVAHYSRSYRYVKTKKLLAKASAKAEETVLQIEGLDNYDYQKAKLTYEIISGNYSPAYSFLLDSGKIENIDKLYVLSRTNEFKERLGSEVINFDNLINNTTDTRIKNLLEAMKDLTKDYKNGFTINELFNWYNEGIITKKELFTVVEGFKKTDADFIMKTYK